MVALIEIHLALLPFEVEEVQAGKAAPFLAAIVATVEGRAARTTWVDELGRQLVTHFKAKYPGYHFSPYARELERVRGAVSCGHHRSTKPEPVVFLKMLATRAYGLDDDAAVELILLVLRAMPAEEYGIIFPGTATEE
jgi:hypothetical protein